MAKKQVLGMGLDALLDDNSIDSKNAQSARISEIEPNKSQPRRSFDEASIQALADSIRQHGLIQPILVRPLESGGYQIVAGERRWRACRMLGLSEVPIIVRDLNDLETMQIALIENLQRENLNPIEEAQGYKDLIERFSMTQDQVSKVVGKSRTAVTNALRLLNLPAEVQQMVTEGDITAGHAKVICGLNDREMQLNFAAKAMNGMSVRALEKLAQGKNDIPAKHERPVNIDVDPADDPQFFDGNDSFYTEMELSLTNLLGRKVTIDTKNGSGKLCFEFYGKDDLTELVHKLTEE
ncbi:MAG: ParB/RepB/Spo0J family partition protein [Ruminococcus sp.]|nr:ParB/RepB/Spo0J family partition protein [Ruminococcus sp.]